MTGKGLKILGYIAAVVGAGASLLGSAVNDKKQDALIAEKVTKALADK